MALVGVCARFFSKQHYSFLSRCTFVTPSSSPPLPPPLPLPLPPAYLFTTPPTSCPSSRIHLFPSIRVCNQEPKPPGDFRGSPWSNGYSTLQLSATKWMDQGVRGLNPAASFFSYLDLFLDRSSNRLANLSEA